MWDFDFGKAIAMVLKTLPFIALRIAVFVGIGLTYVLVVGFGVVLGLAFGAVFSPDPAIGAIWGGAIGLGLTSIGLYLAREYILYLVKAAHIAVLVELFDGRSIPADKGQIGFGTAAVKAHFTESSILFAVDQLVKAVLKTFFRTLNFISGFLPIPGLQALERLVVGVVRVSVTYIDEIILAYLIRTKTANPWATARDGLVLYAQNYKHFLKNAVWLAVFLWLSSAAIFILLLGPAAALVALMPGDLPVLAFLVAFALAWGLKAALLEPVAIAAMMQVYFKTIAGQSPNPEWAARLDQTSGKFAEFGRRAGMWGSRPA